MITSPGLWLYCLILPTSIMHYCAVWYGEFTFGCKQLGNMLIPIVFKCTSCWLSVDFDFSRSSRNSCIAQLCGHLLPAWKDYIHFNHHVFKNTFANESFHGYAGWNKKTGKTSAHDLLHNNFERNQLGLDTTHPSLYNSMVEYFRALFGAHEHTCFLHRSQ